MDKRKPLPRDLKTSPICPQCTGWRDEVLVNGEKWLKCRSCSFMEKDRQPIVTEVKPKDKRK